MYVGRNIIKPIEEIKINDDYIVGASEDQLNQFIDIGVIKKDIRYKLNLEDPTEDQSELVNTLLEKGVL
ncbi:MAG: hypothetical protein CMM53_06440 [Rhodospirillaceae bacterium]|nr:hypothetical protein [Rhodospirillaceae bacterium]